MDVSFKTRRRRKGVGEEEGGGTLYFSRGSIERTGSFVVAQNKRNLESRVFLNKMG